MSQARILWQYIFKTLGKKSVNLEVYTQQKYTSKKSQSKHTFSYANSRRIHHQETYYCRNIEESSIGKNNMISCGNMDLQNGISSLGIATE